MSAPSADDPSCAQCKYWVEQTESHDELRWGWCHRYPPSIVPTVDDGGDEVVAPVKAWTELPYWCGEMKAKQ